MSMLEDGRVYIRLTTNDPKDMPWLYVGHVVKSRKRRVPDSVRAIGMAIAFMCLVAGLNAALDLAFGSRPRYLIDRTIIGVAFYSLYRIFLSDIRP